MSSSLKPAETDAWSCILSPEQIAQALAAAGRRAHDLAYVQIGEFARLAIHGIVARTNPAPGFRRLGFPTDREIESAVEKALNDVNVRALLLEINSPGGELIGSVQLVGRLTKLASKKPLVVFSDGVLCALAYDLATCAHLIVATPNAIVGGIGRASGYKAGFYADTQLKHVRHARRFTKCPLTEAALGGELFFGEAAQQAGLIDKVGTLLDATAAVHGFMDMNR